MIRIYLICLTATAAIFLAAAQVKAEDYFASSAFAHPYVAGMAADWQERTAAMGPVDCDANRIAQTYCRRAGETTGSLNSVKVMTRWVQSVSDAAYRSDEGGDYWGTLADMLGEQAGDCDDLATMIYHAMAGAGELATLAVIHHPKEGAHMVVLWFEDGPGNTPRVLDSTGMATRRPVHLSRIPSWTVLGHFNEKSIFSVK